jgi:hypothetical protein
MGFNVIILYIYIHTVNPKNDRNRKSYQNIGGKLLVLCFFGVALDIVHVKLE